MKIFFGVSILCTEKMGIYDFISPLKFPAQNGWARARHKPSFYAGQGFAQKMGLCSLIL